MINWWLFHFVPVLQRNAPSAAHRHMWAGVTPQRKIPVCFNISQTCHLITANKLWTSASLAADELWMQGSVLLCSVLSSISVKMLICYVCELPRTTRSAVFCSAEQLRARCSLRESYVELLSCETAQDIYCPTIKFQWSASNQASDEWPSHS